MSDTAPIGPLQVSPSPRVGRESTALKQEEAPSTSRGRDSVELSQTAQLLSRIAQLPDIRQGLVDRVRAEIEEGGYDTDEKIEALLDSLAEDLDLAG